MGPLAPDAPTNVSVVRSGWTTATLNWTDASTNETSFQRQISTDGGTTWTNVPGGTTPPTDSAGTGGSITTTITVGATTNALYRVLATNVGGSTASASVGLNNTVPPGDPTNVQVTCTPAPADPADCTVTWENPTNSTAYFSIYGASNSAYSADLVKHSYQPGNVNSSTFTGLSRAKAWYFKVIGSNEVGNSNWVTANPYPVPPL